MFSKNIYRKELKRHRTSAFAWSLSIAALIFIGMAFFPIIMQEDIFKLMSEFFENSFMKSMMSAFGASIDNLTNVLGFYSTRSAMFISLLGSFFSILLASKILAQEEREKTAEFLLSKPVTRLEIWSSKLAAYFTYLVILNGVIIVVGILSLELFKGGTEYRLSAFFVQTLYQFLLMLVFGAIGLFLSLLIRRGRPTTGVSIGIIVGGYFIDTLSKATPAADKIGYISPFKFVDSGVLRPDYGLTWWRVAYFVGLSLVLFGLSYGIFRKKDMLL